ncbi:hypothetical protein NL676_021382 [Syzygium grande]|nr:hypothetical protein NL676_021382 [Syzygium grande]
MCVPSLLADGAKHLAASMAVAVGSVVWVEDPELAWIDAEVVEVNGKEIKINLTSGRTVVANASTVYAKDTEAPQCGVDDMMRLAYLHEPGVLDNLRCRYDLDEIYHVFKMEQEEYTREEIDWSYIEFIDNQDVLDLLEKKPGGIIALLDVACVFPKSTHETFAEKLYQTFKDHKRFSKPKLSTSDFTICHYAELFLDKNKDYGVAEHQALLIASKCTFVSGLLPPLPEESSNSSKFSSIGARFKGVMEAIRISCAGYPTRKNFDELIGRFGILAHDALNGSFDEITVCKKILERVNLDGYQAVIEEAKTQENVKLKSALQEMQLQFEEMKATLVKEQEAAQKEAEQEPIVQEVPAVDHELMDKLAAENKKLKAVVSSLEKKIDETERKLEEKLSDMEADEQVLWQLALMNAPVKKIDGKMVIMIHKVQLPQKKCDGESDNKLRRSFVEKQHACNFRENVVALIRCMTQDLGVSEGVPVAAFTIYKCFLHWRSLEVDRTNVFDRLIQMVGSAIEVIYPLVAHIF